VQAGESIQAAIERAAAGDTIEIERARYLENLLIAKPLTLRGRQRPTLSGGLRGDTIRITATDVTIDGLIVSDSGDSLRDQNAGIYIFPGAHRAVVQNCDLTYNLFGLWIEKADDVRIERNLITGKRDYPSPRSAATASSSTTRGARRSSATTSASCATRSTSMSRTTRCFAATGCTTAATARTT
jgi:nitrous oxidase accessory protein